MYYVQEIAGKYDTDEEWKPQQVIYADDFHHVLTECGAPYYRFKRLEAWEAKEMSNLIGQGKVYVCGDDFAEYVEFEEV